MTDVVDIEVTLGKLEALLDRLVEEDKNVFGHKVSRANWCRASDFDWNNVAHLMSNGILVYSGLDAAYLAITKKGLKLRDAVKQRDVLAIEKLSPAIHESIRYDKPQPRRSGMKQSTREEVAAMIAEAIADKCKPVPMIVGDGPPEVFKPSAFWESDSEPRRPDPQEQMYQIAVKAVEAHERHKVRRLAQKCYEGYRAHSKGKSLATGDDIPEWIDMPAEIQEGWIAGVRALFDGAVSA